MKNKLVVTLVFAFMSSMSSFAVAKNPVDAVNALKAELLKKGAPSMEAGKTYDIGTYKVPGMKFGKRFVINKDLTVVDLIKENKLADVCTVFIKTGDDYIRASTNVMDKDGKRCMRTELKRNGPVYPMIKEGLVYSGDADICGTMYNTYYEPIKIDGKVEGIYLCGFKK